MSEFFRTRNNLIYVLQNQMTTNFSKQMNLVIINAYIPCLLIFKWHWLCVLFFH